MPEENKFSFDSLFSRHAPEARGQRAGVAGLEGQRLAAHELDGLAAEQVDRGNDHAPPPAGEAGAVWARTATPSAVSSPLIRSTVVSPS